MIASEYVSRGHKRTDGWLEPEAAQLIAHFGQWQQVGGNVGEIGVHHGKLFILLHLLRRPEERSVAVDLFELQELNVDRSGRGDRAVFEQNLHTIAGGTDGVTIASADSTTVKSDDLLSMAGGPFRLFSIDGGHTAAITESDLTIASESLVDGGLLILDDYFNQAWPGVSEGTNRFLSSNPTLVPVGSGHGKMYFTTDNYAAAYRDQMVECANAHGWRVTSQPFFDLPHVTVHTRSRRDVLDLNARARGSRAIRMCDASSRRCVDQRVRPWWAGWPGDGGDDRLSSSTSTLIGRPVAVFSAHALRRRTGGLGGERSRL